MLKNVAYIKQCLLANLSVVFLLFSELNFCKMSGRRMSRAERRARNIELRRLYDEWKEEEQKEELTEAVVDRRIRERLRERLEPVRVLPFTVFQDPPAGNLECQVELTDQEHRDLLWDLGLLF